MYADIHPTSYKELGDNSYILQQKKKEELTKTSGSFINPLDAEDNERKVYIYCIITDL